MNKPALPLLGLLVLVLSACSSDPVKTETPVSDATRTPAAQTPASPAPTAANPGGAAMSSVATVNVPPYLDPANQLARERSVYFDFDSVQLDRDDMVVVERHGRYLADAPRVAVRIEGNADERGGVEYNLALGQRRAEAVVQGLALLGVQRSQMEAISWGEERPRATGHDESAWTQNRRADIVYPNR